ncbi:MAG TPA: DNA phosphorothioation-dependent restriction protein DptF [Gammaproteobacteria bacterium]|nr:DNA phosphorothioation-dependent restriction protein DptF [Gammaproteobacteria bacterium]
MDQPTTIKEALFPLKESSMSAIADADCGSFDEIKQYLHLNRDIEYQLETFLEAVKKTDTKKLVLVCGNVGDGKSHLLAALQIDQPDLLSGITLHNDATESSEPKTTSLEELKNLLEPFSDEKLNYGTEKIALAINLGTLNNFLTSDSDNRFSQLKSYVKEKKILDVGDIVDSKYDEGSPFQSVNFCDHNLFNLTKTGPISEIIETALERIVSPDGPFFEAYKNQKTTYPKKCPICFNFESLQSQRIRKKISSLLIKCIVKGEIILSIRSLYNFIYELIVPIGFEQLDDQAAINKIQKFSTTEFLQNILPNYIFSHPELSCIFEQIQKNDPAIRRGEIIDETIIELVVSESPSNIINQHIAVDELSENVREYFLQNSSDDHFVNTFIRTAFFWPKSDNHLFRDATYNEFMQLLFEWYSGESKALKSLYNLVKNAAISWNGIAGPGKINVNIGRQQLEYRISEQVNIKPDPPRAPECHSEHILKFNTSLPLRYKVDGKTVSLYVPYSLFDLIIKIEKGYRATKLDHSDFVVFDDFVHRVTASGEGRHKVFFTESNNNRQFVLELDDFGDFCFTEVTK